MVEENCIPLDHDTHISIGGTRESTVKMMPPMFRNVGAERIGIWYSSLWKEHGLSVDRGILYPIEDLPVHELVHRMRLGADIHRNTLPADDYWMWDKTNYLAAVAVKLKGKSPKWSRGLPREWKDFDMPMLYEYMVDGHWALYLMDTFNLYIDNWI